MNTKSLTTLPSYPNVLIIGGNSRHAGKTTMACAVIEKFVPVRPVTALKVTRITPSEESFHGSEHEVVPGQWQLFRETGDSGEKDTTRMIRAGAAASYYIQACAPDIIPAFHQFLKEAGPDSLVICESRILRRHIIPGVYILMLRNLPEGRGKDVRFDLETADAVCESGDHPESISAILSSINIIGNRWVYNP